MNERNPWPTTSRPAGGLGVAFASGFIALSYEILWYRAFSFLTWSSPTTFGVLLAFYLAGLANGALRSRRYCDAASATGDPRQLRPVAAFLLAATVVSFLVVPLTARLAGSGRLWVAGYGLIAVGATLLGTVLPMLSHFGIPPDERAGARVSYLYLANVIGSALGSFLTGFVLLDAWPFGAVALGLALAGFAVAAATWAAARPARPALAGGLAASLALAAATAGAAPRLYDRLWERLLYKENFTDDTRFAELIENRSGVINVTRDRRVFGGGAYDGVFNTGLESDQNWISRAYAVGAMHPAPREVLLIGLGSGSWAQVLAHTPGVERMTAIEINPGYLDLIARHPEVSSLLRNPRATLVVDDGRRWLSRHPERSFDVIAMNTTWHWRAHSTNLLSAEFLELARAHLRPGGILYYNTTGSVDVLATAVARFPHALRIMNCVAVSDSPLRFDRARWRRMLTEVRIDGRAPLDPALPRDRAILGRLLDSPDLEDDASLRARAAAGTVITDDNMVSEWRQPFQAMAGIAPDAPPGDSSPPSDVAAGNAPADRGPPATGL